MEKKFAFNDNLSLYIYTKFTDADLFFEGEKFIKKSKIFQINVTEFEVNVENNKLCNVILSEEFCDLSKSFIFHFMCKYFFDFCFNYSKNKMAAKLDFNKKVSILMPDDFDPNIATYDYDPQIYVYKNINYTYISKFAFNSIYESIYGIYWYKNKYNLTYKVNFSFSLNEHFNFISSLNTIFLNYENQKNKSETYKTDLRSLLEFLFFDKLKFFFIF